MPIEVRELIIKTQITEDDDHFRESDYQLQAERERQLVEKCVHEVLKKLRKKIER
ncbi:MAG: DUF5908 family protein [Cyclobacteriaceae bacterium]